MANISEKLAETVPDRGVKIVYGEKVAVGGTEVIPVAFVSYGFGGGTLSGMTPATKSAVAESDLSSDGSGGWGVAIPVGAYVGTSDGIRFHANPIAALWVAVPLIAVFGWAISRIVKAAG